MLKGRKVLLTGLTGRIGQAIAVRFAPTCEMWGLARYSRAGSREEAERLGVKPIEGDYARGSLAEVPTDFDYVLHVAADLTAKSAEEGLAANCDGAARLMLHCRKAKAFLHVSTTGIYKQHPDPYHVYKETDDLGGGHGGQYAPTKLAGEGAVRAAAMILELPTIICRQNVQYGGPHPNGGLIDRFMDLFLETGEVYLPPRDSLIIGPIHEDDICDLVEPSLGAASVPADTVNWSGDELVDWREMFEYAGRLLGRAPKFVHNPEFTPPNCCPDPAKRRMLAGPCKVSWKEGVRRSLEIRHPGVKLQEDSQ
jgi:UDP-glucuronate 4-epimerase